MLLHHSWVISRNLLIRTGAFALATSVGTLCAAQQLDSPAVTPTTSDPSSGKPDSEEPLEVAPTKAECIAAHHETQAAENDVHLLLAQKNAKRCTHQGCPALLVSDCANWLIELDQKIPSMVFEVRVDGQANSTAKVEVDGNPVGDWARGEALKLDPGEHEVRFSLDSYAPIIQSVLLGEGMRFRLVSANFQGTSPQGPTSPSSSASLNTKVEGRQVRAVPPMVYPLLGVGVLGVAGFIGLTLSGSAEHDRLTNACAPYCTDSEINGMRTRYIAADISLGIGVTGLIGAGILYLTRPEHTEQPAIGIATIPNGAMATLRLKGF